MTLDARPRAVDVIVYGGLAAGALDIVNATVFWRLYNGAAPAVILQAIAAGLLGKDAFAGGAVTAALGLFLHFFIACGMGAVYWLACLRWPSLIAKPVAAGIAYGVLTWLAMNYLIVPLSRAMPPPFIPSWFIDGVLAHVLLVGLLLAFVARRSALRGRSLACCP
ncbi:MAG TPA: hypothetical protein VGA24_00705 [Steroidobacteraceae bacterium]